MAEKTEKKVGDDQIVVHNLEDILQMALLVPKDDPRDPECRWGAPICLWGSPGIGKSGRVEVAGTRLQLPVETVYLATRQPEDISGAPFQDVKNGGITIETILGAVRTLVAAKKGVLFLDELSCARPAIQGAALGVVYERKVGDTVLPPRVRVVAAANPPEEAAGGWMLSPPMANRFMHFTVPVPSRAEWSEWLMGNDAREDVNLAANEAMVAQNWDVVWARVKGAGAGFMLKSPDDTLYALPREGSKDRTRAWRSPRSWELGLRAVATCRALGRPELELELLTGCVGHAGAEMWATYNKNLDLPDPKEMLEKGWTPDKMRLDVCHAAYSSAISYALDPKDKKEQRARAILAWKLLQGGLNANIPDIIAHPAKTLMKAGYRASVDAELKAVAGEITLRFGHNKIANMVSR